MQNFFGYGISILFFIVGVSIPGNRESEVQGRVVPMRAYPDVADAKALPQEGPYDGIVFRHGDISWLPKLAAIAGWPEETWDTLGHIVLRESGGCPYRAGGDRVGKNCEIINVVDQSHRSDTGLLQVNGVHWKTDHPHFDGKVCRELNICDNQEALMDPITNLRAGKVIYDHAGWSAWDACTFGPKYKHICERNKKSSQKKGN